MLGPSGEYKVGKVTGDVKVAPMEGDLPGRPVVTGAGPGVHPFTLTIEAGGKKLAARGHAGLGRLERQVLRLDGRSRAKTPTNGRSSSPASPSTNAR